MGHVNKKKHGSRTLPGPTFEWMIRCSTPIEDLLQKGSDSVPEPWRHFLDLFWKRPTCQGSVRELGGDLFTSLDTVAS